MKNTKLSKERAEELLAILEKRFLNNMNRHADLKWDDIQKKLEEYPNKLWSLNEMEGSEGEPDVIGYDEKTKNSSSVIVRQKVRNPVAVSVMIMKPWNPEKQTNRKTAQFPWLKKWE